MPLSVFVAVAAFHYGNQRLFMYFVFVNKGEIFMLIYTYVTCVSALSASLDSAEKQDVLALDGKQQ